MARRSDEGFEFHLPFFRLYAGDRGVHIGFGDDDEEVIEMENQDSEYREVRRRVRARLRFLRHAVTYLIVNTFPFLLDWSTGGGFWMQWVAIIWGAFLAWEFVSQFVAPALWGRDMEERLIERELRRRRDS